MRHVIISHAKKAHAVASSILTQSISHPHKKIQGQKRDIHQHLENFHHVTTSWMLAWLIGIYAFLWASYVRDEVYANTSTTTITSLKPYQVTWLDGMSLSGSAHLHWTTGTSPSSTYPITDYVIQYKLITSKYFSIFYDGKSINTEALVKNLKSGRTYDFRVAARNLKGTGPYSSIITLIQPGTPPTDGVCGSAHGSTVSSKPTLSTALCAKGTSTTVSGTGPWYWYCKGINGGKNASCKANKWQETLPTPTLVDSGITKSGSYVTPLPPIASPPWTDWTKISDEGGTFTLSGTTVVKYGVNTTWTEKTLGAGTHKCDNWIFGDPIYGVEKACHREKVWVTIIDKTTWIIPSTKTTITTPININLPKGTPGITYQRIWSGTALKGGPSRDTFRTRMKFTHMLYDDPIVYPWEPGKAHLHIFYGNSKVDAYTTPENIRTNCQSAAAGGTANCSSYWIPALLDSNNQPVLPGNVPNEMFVYYKTSYSILTSQIPFMTLPPGLRMIAWNAKATHSQQIAPWDHRYSYSCNNDGNRTPHIPNCAYGDELVVQVEFPACWNGRDLDSPDHKSHMAYGDGAVWCPPTHPTPIPTITLHAFFRVNDPTGTSKWKLSNDMYDLTNTPWGYSLHADWFNWWDPQIVDIWMNNCNKALIDCVMDNLWDGRRLLPIEE
jgi:hypothetical protein